MTKTLNAKTERLRWNFKIIKCQDKNNNSYSTKTNERSRKNTNTRCNRVFVFSGSVSEKIVCLDFRDL